MPTAEQRRVCGEAGTRGSELTAWLDTARRCLDRAKTVEELLCSASTEARVALEVDRCVVLTVGAGGVLTPEGVGRLPHEPSDALRRRLLARPVSARSARRLALADRVLLGSPADARAELGLDLGHILLTPVRTQGDFAAVILAERSSPFTPLEAEHATLFGYLFGTALERVLLRLRLGEVSSEMRHMYASAEALVQEAVNGRLTMPTCSGARPVFITDLFPSSASRADTQLTQREDGIARLIVSGHSNREIGAELHLSPDTVKGHVTRMLRKLDASNRVQLAVRLVNLLQPPR